MGTANPLAIILERPYRRSRAENILRELVHTSYPHALLGNLALAVAVQAQYTPDQQHAIAKDFRRGEESSYGVLDFIRCVGFKRKHASIDVVVKTLKVELPLTAVVDDRKNHEVLAAGNIQLPSATFELPDPLPIAQLFLQSYYTARSPRETTALVNSTWISRTRLPLAGRSNEFTTTDEVVDLAQATQLLVASLQRTQFHLIMTPNTILIMDQRKRLWGLNRHPKA